MALRYPIKLVRGFALFLPCFFCCISLFSQCYEAFKKEGDQFNRKPAYEEAITQYLAALLCPDLEQKQRIVLIELIKKALQARKDQLDSALSTVVDNLLRLADNDILNLDYEGALERIKNAILLEADEKKVGLSLMELVYFFNESGRHQRALSLSNTLMGLLQAAPLAIQQDTMNSIRAYLSRLNPARYQQLEEQYYPIMIEIPGGTFEMGCNADLDQGCSSDVKPLHQVQLSSYGIAQYETTNWQYNLFCISTAQDSIKRTSEHWPLQGNLPVVNVNWYDAIQYSNWLNDQKGLAKAYVIDKENKDPRDNNTYDEIKWPERDSSDGKAYRLPTEAEWEYAARGGQQTQGYKYAGSDKLKDVGWYTSNSNSQPHPVGTLQSNQLDLYHMSGNVSEWCWDWYGAYKTGRVENPRGPGSGTRRVLRGGSWRTYVFSCYVFDRGNYYYDSHMRLEDRGFRVAQGF